jgi:hypothetical protein
MIRKRMVRGHHPTSRLAAIPTRGPIFIVSAMGSGSTLLRLILDSHDRIAIPQETGFMRAYNAHQFVPFKWSGRNWAKRMGGYLIDFLFPKGTIRFPDPFPAPRSLRCP